MKSLTVSIVILSFIFPFSCSAQGSSVGAIEKAAAVYARSLHLSGTVIFDPRPAYEKGTEPVRSPQEIESLAHLLGATATGDQGNYVACSGTPKTCRISGADAIISVNRPEVLGDTAYVIVRVLVKSPSTNQPIHRREDRLLIVKAGGSWKFVKQVGGGSIN